jgi:phosphohistidine swiveling domain-containing protein
MEAAPGFPFVWERPQDAELSWHLDTLHLGKPMPRFSFSFFAEAFVPGFQAARRLYGLKVGEVRLCLFNSYCYEAVTGMEPPPPPERDLEEAADAIGELWRLVVLPEVRTHLSALDAFDLQAAPNASLRAHLDHAWELTKRIWILHFLISYPYMLAISRFDDTYRDLFGPADRLASFKLLQGFDNERHRADRALWLASRSIQTSNAAELDAAAGALLPEQGHRGSDWMPHAPHWDEDQALLVDAIRGQIHVERDPEATREELEAERHNSVAEARRLLAEGRAAKRERFERHLSAAQQAIVVQEDHSWWIDFKATHRLRLIVLEAGRRLVESARLEERGDALHLSIDELRDAISGGGRFGAAALVSERKAEMARFALVAPPGQIGASPSAPEASAAPDEGRDSVDRALDKYFGAPAEASVPREVRGNAASPGVARGRARVVRSRREAGEVRRGEVLVTRAAGPDWTPFFSVVAAIVTEVGGVASHAAGVAREYGLPAVTGASRATELIEDGAMVEVDGGAGVVWIVSPEEPSGSAAGSAGQVTATDR